MSSSSGWMNWAMENVTPARMQQALGWAKENVDEKKLNELKNTIGAEIQDALAEQKQVEAAKGSKWASWFPSSSKSSTAPATPAPATPAASTRQKYIKMAVQNWKITLPIASFLFSFILSWSWWILAGVGIYMYMKKKKQA